MSDMTCGTCHRPIVAPAAFSAYEGVKHHADCWRCGNCRKELGSEPFATNNDTKYCSPCYDNMFGTKCEQCHQLIEGQMVTSPSGRGMLHIQCFVCATCRKPIGGEQYFPENDRPYCSRECRPRPVAGAPPAPPPAPAPVPKIQMAPGRVIKVKNERCSACDQDCLEMEKLNIMNRIFHKRCFRCATCNCALKPDNYQGVDGKPYCKAHYPKPVSKYIPPY
eukprot:TRINITY_DN2450_c0_g1_i2.p1 TRINITY_DN2450_c0_g1~~TRINITY_DN2450_c0_g1_i2.p1  ORF type:complete len:250 (+),score=36.45 TRINITY_DN2450_c0_g1_i2:89-751(+)